MNWRRHFATLVIIILLAECVLCAQARKEVSYDWAPDVVAATFLYTIDDYSLQVSSSSLQRTRLGGVEVEYASRHFYPWEIVGAARYSEGCCRWRSSDQLRRSDVPIRSSKMGTCARYERWRRLSTDTSVGNPRGAIRERVFAIWITRFRVLVFRYWNHLPLRP